MNLILNMILIGFRKNLTLNYMVYYLNRESLFLKMEESMKECFPMIT